MTDTLRPDTLSDLIARLERCEGPSREMDSRIQVALATPEILGKVFRGATVEFVHYSHTVPDYRKYETGCTVPHAVVRISQDGHSWIEAWDDAPRYTGSVDAALRVVPDDAFLCSLEWDDEPVEHPITAHVMVERDSNVFDGYAGADPRPRKEWKRRLPILLCIAALRALQKQERS